jgi:dCMP deaminase
VRCNGQNYSADKLTDLDKVVAGCGVNLEECLCLHAEENALLEAGRDRITNSTLYCNTSVFLSLSLSVFFLLNVL